MAVCTLACHSRGPRIESRGGIEYEKGRTLSRTSQRDFNLVKKIQCLKVSDMYTLVDS